MAISLDEYNAICDVIAGLSRQAELDRQSREASQAEFARLNRELNEARDTAQKLGAMLDETCKALGEARLEIARLEQGANR